MDFERLNGDIKEMRRRNREINAMCKSFEPVMYEVQAVFDD